MRRKFLNQVIYHVGGGTEDQWELRIVFSHKSDQTLTNWNEIANTVEAFMKAFVESTIARPVKRPSFKEAMAELQADHDKRRALGDTLSELLKVLIQSDPWIIGQAISDGIREVEVDAGFESRNPQLRPVDIERLQKLYRDLWESYRAYRRSLR